MSDWWARGKEPLLQNEAEVDTEDMADAAVETAKIADTNVTTAKIADDAVTQAKIDKVNRLNGAVVRDVQNVDVVGGIPVLHLISAVSLTGDIGVGLTHKTRVIDVWAVATATGGVGDTIQVKNGDTAITDAIDLNVADKVVKRAATIDDAQHEIAANGTLRVTGASGANAEVYVLGIRVA